MRRQEVHPASDGLVFLAKEPPGLEKGVKIVFLRKAVNVGGWWARQRLLLPRQLSLATTLQLGMSIPEYLYYKFLS